ncbi:carbohydrate ABC transporter permease [Corynebacterium afermentans]|uniref:carbohydrate ABC transporter permease n=1 Tax=Corynebacterium afermentans TaxID=38286 RepID=UPI002572A1CA|nr:carbohydrate ABC transporter permease [Corynebacterium afermentans]MCG7291492.1 carbohydrate ABC transporter permease [Corynebacterium afermentans]
MIAQQSKFIKFLLTIIAVLVTLAFLVPTLWMISSSLRPQSETFSNASDISIWTFLPQTWTVEHYSSALTGDFARALVNSLFVAAVSVVLGLGVATLAAFAISAMQVRGAGFVFAVIVISFLVPFEAIAVPLSSSFRDLGLHNTYVGLILPGLGHGLAIFYLRQFFDSLPRELSEAARMDGASWGKILTQVYLPLSRSSLVGAGIILFMFQWQAYLWPLLVATRSDMLVGPIAIARMFGEYSTDYGSIFAGSVLLALVPAALLFFFQRQFTQSLATSGMKE